MVKYKAVKKKAVKKASKKSAKKKKYARYPAKKKAGPPPGYKKRSSSKVLVPIDTDEPAIVDPPAALRGINDAKSSIRNFVETLSDAVDGWETSEIKCSISFSAEGKFLGFGVGGATSFEISFRPSEE